MFFLVREHSLFTFQCNICSWHQFKILLCSSWQFSDILLYTFKGVTLTNQFRVRGQIPLDTIRVCFINCWFDLPLIYIRKGRRSVRPRDNNVFGVFNLPVAWKQWSGDARVIFIYYHLGSKRNSFSGRVRGRKIQVDGGSEKSCKTS